jgi:hypothetical protein
VSSWSKCCSNVLQPLIAYGVPVKAVRTCVCEENDTAHVRSAIPYIPCTNVSHYYAVMRAGDVLHSLECLECGVVGKCCSYELRSGVAVKAVRTRVCEDDTAHVRNSRCVISYRVRGHIHPCIRVCRHTKYKHAHTTCKYTYLHSSAQHNSIYHAQTCLTTTHSYEQAMYCTHSSVWSVELWASDAAMRCAPSVPIELNPRLYAHVCEKTIQRTYVTQDARFHTHNRMRGHIHPYIRACRHTKYKHACMPCT